MLSGARRHPACVYTPDPGAKSEAKTKAVEVVVLAHLFALLCDIFLGEVLLVFGGAVVSLARIKQGFKGVKQGVH